ncbi:hypothetical protein [Niallia sp. 03091]|uniref:hypothetical protein n=1 Tax=unclassified Niallia TaxID=2837522 RepID=UPI0040448044
MEGSNLNESNEKGKKKISLQEAMKQQLANKKQNAQNGKANLNGNQKMQKLNSQQTKKPNNQRKRTGV